MRSKQAFKLLAAMCLCACLAALSGCSSSGHQVIDSGEACSSCHSTEKEQFEVADPAGALHFTPGTTVTVDSGSDALKLCKPIYTSADGSSYVPVLNRNLSTGGTVEVTLDEGVWVLAADLGDASRSVIAVVSPEGENSDTSITL